jgi:Tfp pilus assembly protein PilX
VKATHYSRGQRGATLIVALIMLVALAMLSLWSFNSGTMNLRVVGNSQARQEVVAAAQAATEMTLSTPARSQSTSTATRCPTIRRSCRPRPPAIACAC